MLKEIIQYPTPPSAEYSTDVRVFNEEIETILEDLKDTINEYNFPGLAAFQIGSYYNLVVIKKDDGSFLELINPRLLSTSGKITTTETTAYFPGLSASVTRHDKISLIYQNREMEQLSLKAEGEFSVLLQRKIDYTFGSNFLSKLSKEEKNVFEQKLEFGADFAVAADSCPTTFKRDYVAKAFNISLIIMVLVLFTSFFISAEETLAEIWHYQSYLALASLTIIIIYFFYAHYEAKLYTSCISCQSGNIIGTAVISIIKLTALTLLSFFLI